MAQTPHPTDNVDELLDIAWINPEGTLCSFVYHYKPIFNSNSTSSAFYQTTDEKSFGTSEINLKEKWKTGDGSIFYRFEQVNFFGNTKTPETTFYVLLRLSPDKSFIELSYLEGYPPKYLSKIDPNDLFQEYRIYYRQN